MITENGSPPGAILGPELIGNKVISSTVLGVVSWWLGAHVNLVTVRDLVVRSFKSDDIFTAWAKLREAHQLASGQDVVPPTRHRSETKLSEEFVKEVSEAEKSGIVSFVLPASELGLVRGLIDSNVGDDRPVASRLESLEDMMKGVVEKLSRIETYQSKAVKVPEVVVQQPRSVHVTSGQGEHVAGQPSQAEQQQSYAAVTTAGLSLAQQLLTQRPRRLSSSVKRSVSGAERDQAGNVTEKAEEVFTEVSRKKKKKELSTGTADLQSIPGVEVPLQASYQHFVANTPGNMDKDTLEKVFKELSKSVMAEKGIDGELQIEDCNLLTKEENTRTRVWRVLVPNKFRVVMQDDRQ